MCWCESEAGSGKRVLLKPRRGKYPSWRLPERSDLILSGDGGVVHADADLRFLRMWTPVPSQMVMGLFDGDVLLGEAEAAVPPFFFLKNSEETRKVMVVTARDRTPDEPVS